MTTVVLPMKRLQQKNARVFRTSTPGAARCVKEHIQKNEYARLRQRYRTRPPAAEGPLSGFALHVTLGHRLKHLAPGQTTRNVLAKLSAVQMIDVRIPTSDGRELALTRHTQPQPDLKLLLEQLKLTLPAQPPPKITASQAATPTSL